MDTGNWRYVPISTTVYITRQEVYVKRNIEARKRNDFCSGKAMNIAYSECVFLDSVMQHAMRMRRIILSSVACPAVPYFSHII
jgi:hypothetical protein